jgi:hypothetical protein
MLQEAGDLLFQQLFYTAVFCYLAGGSVRDSHFCAGLSHSSFFYRAVHHVINAINTCPVLSIKFPITLAELSKSVTEFNLISSHSIMKGCVASHIHVPSTTEVKKSNPFFSGHYQCYELNVQAT